MASVALRRQSRVYPQIEAMVLVRRILLHLHMDQSALGSAACSTALILCGSCYHPHNPPLQHDARGPSPATVQALSAFYALWICCLQRDGVSLTVKNDLEQHATHSTARRTKSPPSKLALRGTVYLRQTGSGSGPIACACCLPSAASCHIRTASSATRLP